MTQNNQVPQFKVWIPEHIGSFNVVHEGRFITDCYINPNGKIITVDDTEMRTSVYEQWTSRKYDPNNFYSPIINTTICRFAGVIHNDKPIYENDVFVETVNRTKKYFVVKNGIHVTDTDEYYNCTVNGFYLEASCGYQYNINIFTCSWSSYFQYLGSSLENPTLLEANND